MTEPRLLFIVTEDWYFLSHRLPMARAARDAGFAVSVATHDTGRAAEIEAEGFRTVALPAFPRGGMIASARMVARLMAMLKQERPDLIHLVALVPCLLGGLAARFAAPQAALLFGFTGMGHAFTGIDAAAQRYRRIVTPLLKIATGHPSVRLLVQNPDDRDLLQGLLPARADTLRLIPGSGIDPAQFPVMKIPDETPTIGFVGRMLEDKGVHTLVDALHRVRRLRYDVRLILAGMPDPKNPSSISESQLRAWAEDPAVEWLGHVEDIRTVWERAHVAVLPSRREGLPKTLLEAAACGRPLIACDVPGSREVVRDKYNGLLVPPDDAGKLAQAIIALAMDRRAQHRLGSAGRELIERQFSDKRVGRDIVALYREMVGSPPAQS